MSQIKSVTLISGRLRISGKTLIWLECAIRVCSLLQLDTVEGIVFSLLPLRLSSSNNSSLLSLLNCTDYRHKWRKRHSKAPKIITMHVYAWESENNRPGWEGKELIVGNMKDAQVLVSNQHSTTVLVKVVPCQVKLLECAEILFWLATGRNTVQGIGWQV